MILGHLGYIFLLTSTLIDNLTLVTLASFVTLTKL